MALQISAAARTASADTYTTSVGTAGKLRIYSGTIPANVAASITGTMLYEATLGCS